MKFAAIIIFLAGTNLAHAQNDVATVIKSGVNNASALSEAYLSPMGNTLGAGMNSSWYNTAKPHKLLGFDVTFNTNFVMVPDVAKTYVFDELDVTNLELTGTDDKAPTIFGSKDDDLEATYSIGTQDYTMNLPPGLDFSTIPIPDIRLGLGLVKGTEVNARFMPEYNIWGKLEGKVNYYGFGLKHDLKQWIPGIKAIPILNISLQGAYSKFAFTSEFSDPVYPDYGNMNYNPDDYEDQGLEFDANAFTANMIASVDLPIISFYASGGYNHAKTNMMFNGNFGFPALDDNGLYISKIKDPIDIESKHNDWQGKVGMKLKLAIIHIHAGYTVAEYPVISTGVGISFR